MSSGIGRRFAQSESFETVRLSRRHLMKRSIMLGLTLPAAAALLAACATDDDVDAPLVDPTDDDDEVDEPVDDQVDDDEPDDAPDEDRYGGTLQVALVDELPSFDPHQTTQAIIGYVMWHVYEHLFTWDAELDLIPELAESHEVSDDGLLNTITLPEGVTFHDGSEMTASDVVACMERWVETSGVGASWMEAVSAIEEVDDYTIEVEMSESFGQFVTLLARQNNGLTIYPQEVIDAVGLDPIVDYIGTGPYRFVEHVADSHILLERYEDYVNRYDEPNGYGGAKFAYVDEIYFRPVPDEAARAAGIQAGDYHVLQSTSPDNFVQLDEDPNVDAEFLPPTNILCMIMNTAEGAIADVTMRRAIQARVAAEPVLQASYGEGFRLSPSIMLEETPWYTTIGEEYYNQDNPELAREFLEEAGYDGEPIRIITSEHENFHINNALTIQQQLEEADMNVEVLVYDWPTLSGEIRQDPGAWELLTSALSIRPDPGLLAPMPGTNWPGWWDSDRKVELVSQLFSETDFDIRFAIWEDIQLLFYEDDLPFLKHGEALSLHAQSPNMRDFDKSVTLLGSFFWNVWLDE